MQRCRFPLAAQGSDHSQDAIHEEPVVLAAKGQQRRVEASCSLVVTQGDGCERQAHHQRCRGQYLFRQGREESLQTRYGGGRFLTFAYRGLDEPQHARVDDHLPQTILGVLTDQCGLEFAQSGGVIFPLVSQKPLALAQKRQG